MYTRAGTGIQRSLLFSLEPPTPRRMLFSSMSLRRALFPRTSSLTRKVPVQASITRSVRHTHAPAREIKNIYPPLAAYPGKMDTRKTPNVVIIGCSYAGMSAAMTLIALKDGLQIPFASYGDYSHLRNLPSNPDFNITMIDERDGFCMISHMFCM